MRWTLLLTILTGALAMSDAATATADDKKEKEFVKLTGKVEYTEKVTLRPWSEFDKRFNKEQANIKACRFLAEGDQKSFWIEGNAGGKPAIKSEIVDENSNVYIVTKAAGSSPYLLRVTKKP